MNRYSNLTIQAMQGGYRNIGLEFDLDFSKWGFETFLNNVLTPSVFGIRPFWRPWGEFTIGLTYATDINIGPKTALTQESEVHIVGADLSQPILGKWLVWFADGAWILKYGNGWASGFRGDIGPVFYRLEYRNQEPDFIPGYFNNYYETSKPPVLPPHAIERVQGYYGELGIDFFKLVGINLFYEDSLDNAGASREGYPRIHGTLSLNNELFALFKQRISAGASYDLTEPCNPALSRSVFEAKLLYGISSNVDMIYVFTQRYSLSTGQVRTSSLQTQIHF